MSIDERGRPAGQPSPVPEFSSRKLAMCTKVKAIHIFSENQKNVEQAYEKLQDRWVRKGKGVSRGEFLKIAQECSAKVGELVWSAHDKKHGWLFENVAFGTPVGAISAPFQSGEGYHIIVVEERMK